MTDKQAGAPEPARTEPANDRSAQTEKFVRWIVWIGLAAVLIWFFADLMIRQ